MSKQLTARRLLWVDCGAGLLVGAVVLAMHGWLAEWYGLPQSVVIASGVANVAYAAFSFSLARRIRRPASLIRVLVVANGAWAVLCVIAALVFADQASLPGMAHILGEGVVVGWLAVLEWRYREWLVMAT